MFSAPKIQKIFRIFGAPTPPPAFFILIFNNLRYFLTVSPLSEIPPMPSFFLLY